MNMLVQISRFMIIIRYVKNYTYNCFTCSLFVSLFNFCKEKYYETLKRTFFFFPENKTFFLFERNIITLTSINILTLTSLRNILTLTPFRNILTFAPLWNILTLTLLKKNDYGNEIIYKKEKLLPNKIFQIRQA